MRAHGVTNFPDPTAGGRGFSFRISGGFNPFAPAVKAAQTACRKLLPGGGPASGPPSAQAKAHLLAISECMRAHGVSDFPDPTTTQPSGPNYSLVLGNGGVYLAVPTSDNVQSPAFKRAAIACHFGVPGGH